MQAGEVKIDRSLFQVAMPEQDLDGSQVRAGFEQMSGEAVPQNMRMNLIAEARTCGGLPAGVPHYFATDGSLAGVPAVTGKQPCFWPSPQTTPVLAQRVQQFRAQHDIA